MYVGRRSMCLVFRGVVCGKTEVSDGGIVIVFVAGAKAGMKLKRKRGVLGSVGI
jgi:hypothetical protein